jgi:anti-sigma B factor antagonist
VTLDIETIDHPGGVTIVRATGEVDLASARALKETLLNLLVVGGHARLVVDHSPVTFIDSTGLGVLFTAYRRVEAIGGFMRVAANREIIRLMRLAHIDDILGVHASVEEAARRALRPSS